MAKVEFDLTGRMVLTTIALLVIGVIVGYLVAGYTASPESKAEAQKCLTIQDLNRQDLIGVITLSRFCEGIGLTSSVLQQQDSNGNIYGLPVCVPVKR